MQVVLAHLATGRALPPLARGMFVAAGDWAERQRGRWGLWLPPCMAAGAIGELAARAEPPVWLGVSLTGGAAALILALRRHRWARMPACAAFAAALGVLSAQTATIRAPPLLDVPRRAVVVTGTVAAVEALPAGLRLTIAHPALRLTGADQDAQPAARTVRIRLRQNDPLHPEAGDVVRVRAMLSPPSPPSFPGSWDLRRDAFFLGIGAYGFALNPAEMVSTAHPGGLAVLLQRLRETIARRVAAVLPPDQAAIATTLLTGSASAISGRTKAAFRDSGLAHLLAIAGLHIGIVMGLVFGAVRLGLAAWEWAALRWPTKAIAALASVSAGGGYMLLTGSHVPIMRSFAMACLVTLAALTGRRALSLRGLALAMAAIVLIAPDEVMGVSFQMSFSAVLALVAGYDALRPWLRRLRGGSLWRGGCGYVLALVVTSALAGTASTPYGAYHFGRVQLYYVVANVAAVPITAFWVMPLGLLALALMPAGLEAVALIPMGWGELAILWIGRSVAALPEAVVAVPAPSPFGLILFSLGLAWLGIWRGRVRLAGVPAMALGVLSALLVRPPDLLISPDGRLIGARTLTGVFLEAGSGAAAFTRDAWQQVWAGEAVLPFPESGGACDEMRCLVNWAGQAAWIARAPPPREACAAAVILSGEPVRLRCPAGATVIDRFSVWREGATAIWLDPAGPRVLTAHDVTGERPWAPPPVRARVTPGLPFATPE